MLSKRMAIMKKVFANLLKTLLVSCIVVLTIILIETIQENSKNVSHDCTESASEEFGLGLRPNMNGKITFGFGSDDSGFNLMDVFSFED